MGQTEKLSYRIFIPAMKATLRPATLEHISEIHESDEKPTKVVDWFRAHGYPSVGMAFLQVLRNGTWIWVA